MRSNRVSQMRTPLNRNLPASLTEELSRWHNDLVSFALVGDAWAAWETYTRLVLAFLAR